MRYIDESWIAKNHVLGAVYTYRHSMEPMRLVTILPCEGVWMEKANGSGYGETIPFEDVLYATDDEVQDFLEDLRERKEIQKKIEEYEKPSPSL